MSDQNNKNSTRSLDEMLEQNEEYLTGIKSKKQQEIAANKVAADRRQLLIEKSGGSPTERYGVSISNEADGKVLYIIDLLDPDYQNIQDQANITGEEINLTEQEPWFIRVNTAQAMTILSESITNKTINVKRVLQWIKHNNPTLVDEVEEIEENIHKQEQAPKEPKPDSSGQILVEENKQKISKQHR